MTASPEPVPADGVRDLLDDARKAAERIGVAQAVGLSASDQTQREAATVIRALSATVTDLIARADRAEAERDALLAGPVGQIIAERDAARSVNVDLHRRAQKAEGFRERHGAGAAYLFRCRLRDRHARRAAEARAATLATALKPFADIAGQWDCMRSGDPSSPDSTQVRVDLGLLRAALRAERAALSPHRPETGDRTTEVPDA